MTEHEPTEPEAERPPDPERLAAPERPRVWIGSLSDYNNGSLHGEWMNADVEEAELIAQIHAMLARAEEQPAEEWMIFDSENFVGYRVGEWEDLDTLTRVARGIAEHGPAFAALAELHGGNPAVLEHFDEIFLGAYDSREAWAQSVVDDFDLEHLIERDLQVPDWLKAHIRIDLSGIAHDLTIGGDVTIEDNPEGGIWVFDGRV